MGKGFRRIWIRLYPGDPDTRESTPFQFHFPYVLRGQNTLCQVFLVKTERSESCYFPIRDHLVDLGRSSSPPSSVVNRTSRVVGRFLGRLVE